MNKDFFKGTTFTLSIVFALGLFGVVYSSGWHIADEILPGIFTGDYTFNGSVNVTSGNDFCIEGGNCLSSATGGSGIPTGAIMAFYLSSCPVGWIAADGTSGTPDLRGQFIRGLNDFGSVTGTRSDGKEDPDGGSRILGDWQNEDFLSHNHIQGEASYSAQSLSFGKNSEGYVAGHRLVVDGGSRTGNPLTSTKGGNETRPKNVALIYCQKT